MDEARSEPLWRAVRIATLAAMAAVVFGSALAITTKMWDSDLAVNTGEPEPRVFSPGLATFTARGMDRTRHHWGP